MAEVASPVTVGQETLLLNTWVGSAGAPLLVVSMLLLQVLVILERSPWAIVSCTLVQDLPRPSLAE